VEGTFAYDGAGNVKRIGTRRFAYDGLDRLVAFHEGGSPVETYAWDRWGNLTELVNTDSGHGGGFTLRLAGATNDNRPELLTVPGAGSATLGWSARGNLTSLPALGPLRAKQLTFSNEDRLLVALDSSSGTRWRHAYDAAGERVASWRRSGTGQLAELRLFVRDEAASVLSEWLLLPGGDFGPARDYLHAGDRVVAQLDWTEGGPLPRFLAHDHLGSTRVVIEADGTMTDLLEYEPFGAFRSGGPVPDASHLFTGHERDLGASSSELDFMHARYYSPALARFVSVDTVGGDPSSSQSWNRYSYTRGNPLRAVDSTGLWQEDVHYHLTQYLARAAGFSVENAGRIARANQSVDETQPALPWDPQAWATHFSGHDQARALFAAAAAPDQDENGRLGRIGRALHTVQDACSHENYWWPDGHLLMGSRPDTPWLHPDKAMATAEESFELLGGDSSKLNRSFLEMVFLVRSKQVRSDLLDLGFAMLGGDTGGISSIQVRGKHDYELVSHYFTLNNIGVRIDGFAQ
jgi:RHS repeat-associated protein